MNRPELFRRAGAPVAALRAVAPRDNAAGPTQLVFTVQVGPESFGLPIEHVQTVFRIGVATPVPLAPPHVTGLVNLRGKVLTALSLTRRLEIGDAGASDGALAVCVRVDAEDFALIVDAVHDVVALHDSQKLPAPAHVADARADLTSAFYRHGQSILPVLDLHKTVADQAAFA